jgi:hypothetical protein
MTTDTLLERLSERLRLSRRSFIKASAAGAATLGASNLVRVQDAKAFAYEPYPTDDQLTTVVTSCAHNCGSRHVLVAHKKGDVIVRLSTDDGRFQQDGFYGKDTLEEPQLRACLRGRSYRMRVYSPERLLYPMVRVGERGEGKFKRVSWDEALDLIAGKMIELKQKYGPTAMLDQSYAGASYGVLHKSDQIEACSGASSACSAAAPARGRCRPTRAPPPVRAGPSAPSRTATRTTRSRTQAHHHVGLESRLHLPRRQHLLLHADGQAERLQVRAGRSAIHRFGCCVRRLVDPDQAQHRRRDDGRAWRTISLPTICRIRPSSTNSAWAWMPAPCRRRRSPNGQENFKDYIPARTTGWRRRPNGPLRSVASAPRTSRSSRIFMPHQAGRAEGVVGARDVLVRRAVQPHGGGAAGHDRQHRRARRLR